MKHTIMIFLILFAITLGVLLGLREFKPATFHSIMITFELTPNAEQEKARLDKIRLLAISDEKKQILINRTIFLGASTKMVQLALGDPINTQNFEEYSPPITRWVYHFADDSRPTVLEFHDGKLDSAFKVSAHKLNVAHQETQPPAPAQ